MRKINTKKMIEYIIIGGLAYFVYTNMAANPSKSYSPKNQNYPINVYGSMKEFNSDLEPRFDSVSQGSREIGRLGTPKVEAVQAGTGQILFSYNAHPQKLARFYNYKV